jgi:hypothetical protein
MNFAMDWLVSARRTRDAITQIKSLEAGDRDRKYLLAAWFREHTRAAPTVDQKRVAYDTLLGRDRNAHMRG